MNIKSIAAYFVLIIISILFMLFLDGAGGCYLLIVLVLAAVVSVSLCIYTKKTIGASLGVSEDVLNKGDTVKLSLTVTKRGILPSSVLSAEFVCGYNLVPLSPNKISTVMLGRDENSFSAEFKAKYFGKCRLGLVSFVVSDFLGLCSFRIPISQPMLEVKIYPDVPEICEGDSFARGIADSAVFSDSEETTQSVNSINGTPGYEHRQYTPGDSLKMINWKLSAKKGELLVRCTEGAGNAEQTFILDKKGDNHDTNQLAVEALLGLANNLSRLELPLRVYIRFGDLWEEISIKSPMDIGQLRYRITEYLFAENDVNRFPNTVNTDHLVVFSPKADIGLRSFTDSARAIGKSCSVAVCTGNGGEASRIETDNGQIRFVN